MKKILTFFIAIIISSAVFQFAHAEDEQINFFNSDITVNQDASISVVETIEYVAPYEKHGIFRNIPIAYEDKDNKKFYLGVSDISVKRDGSDEKYSQSKSGDDLELKIGDKDKTITGAHKYEISYKLTGVINNFDSRDELYWNVTGEDWDFPIEKTSATVRLPDQIKFSDTTSSCYTGPAGSTEKNCQINSELPQTFSTDKTNLTVAIDWPTGIIDKTQRNYSYAMGYLGAGMSPALIVLIFALPLLIPIGVFIAMYKSFKKTGYDLGRRKISIAPEFAPPKDLNPAEMGIILDENLQMRELTAEIIKFAVDGFIKIVEVKGKWYSGKDYELTKIKELPKSASAYQVKLMSTLFNGNQTRKISQLKTEKDGYKDWNDIKSKAYEDVEQKGYFTANPQAVRSKYYIIGVIMFFVGILTIIVGSLGGSLILSAVIVLIFARLMPQRTAKGSEALAQIKGFEMFIARAEKYRAKWAEKENLFFDFLPYAIMFDQTKKWANAFKGVDLGQPDWYQGNWATFNAVYFASSLSNFSSGISSASMSGAQGGSGAGGGGFSGGGFGGGGGGSW